MGNSPSKNPSQVRQQIQQNLITLASSSSLRSPSNLTKIISKYESSIPERLHVVLYYELAKQLNQILIDDSYSTKYDNKESENNLGVISPEWMQFFVELLEKAILCFQLYCMPIGGIGKEPKLQQFSIVKPSTIEIQEDDHVAHKNNTIQLSNHASPNEYLSSTHHMEQERLNSGHHVEANVRNNSNLLQQDLSLPTVVINQSQLSDDPSLQDLYACYLESHIQLGHIYYERKEYEKALLHYLDGKYSNHFRLACLYFAIEAFESAIEEYKRIPDYQEDVYSLNNIGVAYEGLSKWELAKEYYMKALKLDPDYGMAQFNLRGVEWKLAQKEKTDSQTRDHYALSDISNLSKAKSFLWRMNLGIVTHWEYALLADEAYYFLPSTVTSATNPLQHSTGRKNLQNLNWEILVSADQVLLARNGYFAIAFVNHVSRNVVISTRGTDDSAGVRADLWLTFDEFSIQFALARGFSKIVRNVMLSKNISHYRISFTGHSLGAAIGEFLCWEEKVSGVTFDSPGCKKLIEMELQRKQSELSSCSTPNSSANTHSNQIDPLSIDVVTYLTAPNLVNTIKQHVGLKLQIYPSEIDDPTTQSPQPPPSTSVQKSLPFYLRWVAPSTAYHTADYIYKELDKLIQHTYQQHAMKNIVRTLSEPNPKDIIEEWPCGPFQCWTYTKGFSKLNNLSKQITNAFKNKSQTQPVTNEFNMKVIRDVFEDSLQNMAHYKVSYFDESTVPLEFFSEDLSLLKKFEQVKTQIEIPLSQNVKLLQSYQIEENCVRSTSFLTGCEFKQFIQINRQFIKEMIAKGLKVDVTTQAESSKPNDIISRL